MAQGKVPSFTLNITHMEEGEQMNSCGSPRHFLGRFTHRQFVQRHAYFPGVVLKTGPKKKKKKKKIVTENNHLFTL